MLSTTGRKEKLSVSKGSYIEVSSDEHYHSTGNVWYHALLQENLASSKRKKLSVLHLNPLTNEDYSPPLITTTFHRLIRPLPPPDPYPEAGFEEGDMIDAAHRGGWWSGWVIKALDRPQQRFLVYLRFGPDVIEVERKDMRPHWVWKDDEWFRCEKRVLSESEFRAGTEVEVRTKVEPFGDIWAPGIAIKENEDGTMLVKYMRLNACRKANVPNSKVRPSPPCFGLRGFGLMENVDVLIESGWCPSVVSMVLCEDRYTVLLGRGKKSEDFDQSQLRPSVEWRDGAWQTKEKVSDREESPHAAEETTRIRVNVRGRRGTAVKNLPSGKESVTENVSQLPQTPVSSGDLASEMANVVISENTLVTKEPEIAKTKEYHSPIVLGVAATRLPKPPRKKLKTRKNQKGPKMDSVGEKAHEKSNNRESVNKRKRGRPHKFISTEPKQTTGVAASDPMLNAVVEKNVDVVKTPKAKETTMALPFVKKSPCWKVLESMEIFKAVPQRPHFNPLLECEEESREGDAIGAMVKFTGLLERVSDIQVDDSVTELNRIKECFLKLEKHGFDVTAPCSRIDKLLSIKESQTRALEELKVAERVITRKDNKRRKLEDDIEQVPKKIVELQRQLALLKEEKMTEDKEIALIQSHAEILDQKVQNVEQAFRATVTAPWY